MISLFSESTGTAPCTSVALFFEAAGCVLCNRHRIASCDILLASFPEIGLFLFLFREKLLLLCIFTPSGPGESQICWQVSRGQWDCHFLFEKRRRHICLCYGLPSSAEFWEPLWAYQLLWGWGGNCHSFSLLIPLPLLLVPSLWCEKLFFNKNWLSLSCSWLFGVWDIKKQKMLKIPKTYRHMIVHSTYNN